MNHLLRIADLKPADIERIMTMAKDMRTLVERKKTSTMLAGKIMTALFYEPSSRTFGSFVSAMQRLGGGVIPIQGVSYSSVVKGETLKDTVATFSKFSDVIVLRHPEEGSAQAASEVSDVPIINAGDGIGEHPTQALLDLFTIREHFSDISKLTITFVGDLKNGRTVHSLHALLSAYQAKKFHFVSPDELAMPGIGKTDTMDDVLADTDVLYMTRVQKERFSNPSQYEQLKDRYRITTQTMKRLKKSAILMHPFPRVNEIATDVDGDSRAVYLREQIPNGLYVRMALLSLVLAK